MYIALYGGIKIIGSIFIFIFSHSYNLKILKIKYFCNRPSNLLKSYFFNDRFTANFIKSCPKDKTTVRLHELIGQLIGVIFFI